jgi:hypothetical protein
MPARTFRTTLWLTETAGVTQVEQVMTYQLKCGGMGRARDALVMRRQWNCGIKRFLAGLKQHVERVTL